MLRNLELTREAAGCSNSALDWRITTTGENHVSKILSDGDTSGDFDEINGRASSTALSMSPLRWAGTKRLGHLQPGGSSAVSERPPTSTTWRVVIHWLSWFLLEEKCWGLRKSARAEGPETH